MSDIREVMTHIKAIEEYCNSQRKVFANHEMICVDCPFYRGGDRACSFFCDCWEIDSSFYEESPHMKEI